MTASMGIGLTANMYTIDDSCWCVQELFSPFGPISRVYIAYDRDTGENRGFAFVNFVYRFVSGQLL